MLEIHGLKKTFGAIRAIDDLRRGHAGGAGKTSTMMAISGIIAAEARAVRFRGEDISHTPSHEIYRRGIVQVPEGRMIFSELTVRDNLLLGAHAHGASEMGNPELESVADRFPVLRERLHERADTLSGGQLQMLAIARGLMGRPKLFMRDEPSLGLVPLVAEEVFAMIATLSRTGMTILLVEQNVRKALEIADRAYLLEAGGLVETGTTADLLGGGRIMEPYLGSRSRAASGSSQDSLESNMGTER